MHLARISLTPVKGMAHDQPESVQVGADGLRGDRAFCLLDAETGGVLRTASNPALLACRASWADGADGPLLTITTPQGTASGAPRDGRFLLGDYWGRAARLVEVEGPWAELVGAHLGKDVTLCRVAVPGDVTWAGPVSLQSTSSLAELSRREGEARERAAAAGRGATPPAGVAGNPAAAGDPAVPGVPTSPGVLEDGDRFRSHLTVETPHAAPFVEDSWAGRRVRVGEVVLRVRGTLARCAVVDLDPRRGTKADVSALALLAPDRVRDGEVHFAVDADVEEPGTLTRGDLVEVLG